MVLVETVTLSAVVEFPVNWRPLTVVCETTDVVSRDATTPYGKQVSKHLNTETRHRKRAYLDCEWLSFDAPSSGNPSEIPYKPYIARNWVLGLHFTADRALSITLLNSMSYVGKPKNAGRQDIPVLTLNIRACYRESIAKWPDRIDWWRHWWRHVTRWRHSIDVNGWGPGGPARTRRWVTWCIS